MVVARLHLPRMIVVKIDVHLANAFKPSQGGKIVGSAGV